MPVDRGITDSFSSSFLGNMESSFNLDEISSPSPLSASINRKRKYFADDIQDISSIRPSAKSKGYAYLDVEPDDDNPDFLQMPSGNKNSHIVDKTADQPNPSLHDCFGFEIKGDQRNRSSPEKLGTSPLDDSRAVPDGRNPSADPSEISLRAVPKEMPMKEFVEKLAQEVKDRTIQDWSGVFSKMEFFELSKLKQLDRILKAALAYEVKLKKEKVELRNFLSKLSDVLKND